MAPTRRQIFSGVAALAIAPSSLAVAYQYNAELADLAASKGITFGSQIASDYFSASYLGLYRDGAVRVVVPEMDLKAVRVIPHPYDYYFLGADNIVNFAKMYGIAVHGHNLIWAAGRYNPKWIQELPRDKVGSFVDQYIATVVGRYRGRIVSWDVVNEPIGLGPDNVYQAGPFYDALGPGYIARSFQVARAADPAAILVLNEGYTERRPDRSRAATTSADRPGYAARRAGTDPCRRPAGARAAAAPLQSERVRPLPHRDRTPESRYLHLRT
jgi:endo-1,4-beta-xylanase